MRKYTDHYILWAKTGEYPGYLVCLYSVTFPEFIDKFHYAEHTPCPETTSAHREVSRVVAYD